MEYGFGWIQSSYFEAVMMYSVMTLVSSIRGAE
jgi:hypothetical protein